MKSLSQSGRQKRKITIDTGRRTFSVAFSLSILASLSILPPLCAAVGNSPDTSRIQKEETVTLSELHDAGIALARIKQQAINIYVEATRKEITDPNQLEVCDPTSIPVADKDGAPEPPRKNWLVYYLSSLEPIIQLLNNDADEVKGEGRLLVVRPGPKGEWSPLWVDWANHVKSMNDHLTTMTSYFEEAQKNDKAIATEAVAIFDEANSLEKIRKHACKVVAESVP